MAKTVPPSCALTAEKGPLPSITLLPNERSPTNGRRSPAITGKTTPSISEKKLHINGHASPSHLAVSISNSHGGKQIVEGYMKTDDRMRMAKERREERERSLAAREQLIKEKERRARLQYERTVEERWRRLEEQRQKEDLRRAAVEEKRRQQLVEEKERLEALMRRSLERSLQLEQRSKRWSRAGAGESENTPLPFSAASTLSHGIASPLPAVSESAPCSPHRSPFCNSLNPADHSRTGLQGGSQSTPNTPKKERLRRERRTASPGCGSPLRRSESPASVTKQLTSPSSAKLAAKMRAQSPCNSYQHHYSPTRHHPKRSTNDRKAEDEKQPKHNAVEKNTDNNSTHPSLHTEPNVVNNDKSNSCKGQTLDKHPRGDTSAHEKNHSLDGKDHRVSNAQNGDKKKESAPGSPTVKAAAGTTNAEEATRLLTERRRQARAQKELEDKKRELEDAEREEQLRKRLAQKQQQQQQHQQEAKAQQVKDKEKSKEELHRQKQEDDKRQKEQQTQMDREREKAKFQAQEDADRQRQGRELQTQLEEEERQLRKKRIEEIMKRTRKGEADLKKEEQAETKPSPGEEKTVQTNTQVNEKVMKKVGTQVKEQVTVQAIRECILVNKEEAAAHKDNQKSLPGKNNTQQVTPAPVVPDKRLDPRQSSDEHSGQPNREAEVGVHKQLGRQVDVNVSKQDRTNIKATDYVSREPAKLATDAKVRQQGVATMNGAMKGEENASLGRQANAEVRKQRSLCGSAAEGTAKGGSQVEVIRQAMTEGHLALAALKLEPLVVKHMGSCDEVQSMEVSPASNEELISIPKFSPIGEVQDSSVSNTRAVEDLMDLTGSLTYSKLSSECNIGDSNKNLIEGVVSPMSESKLTGMSLPSYFLLAASRVH